MSDLTPMENQICLDEDEEELMIEDLNINSRNSMVQNVEMVTEITEQKINQNNLNAQEEVLRVKRMSVKRKPDLTSENNVFNFLVNFVDFLEDNNIAEKNPSEQKTEIADFIANEARKDEDNDGGKQKIVEIGNLLAEIGNNITKQYESQIQLGGILSSCLSISAWILPTFGAATAKEKSSKIIKAEPLPKEKPLPEQNPKEPESVLNLSALNQPGFFSKYAEKAVDVSSRLDYNNQKSSTEKKGKARERWDHLNKMMLKKKSHDRSILLNLTRVIIEMNKLSKMLSKNDSNNEESNEKTNDFITKEGVTLLRNITKSYKALLDNPNDKLKEQIMEDQHRKLVVQAKTTVDCIKMFMMDFGNFLESRRVAEIEDVKEQEAVISEFISNEIKSIESKKMGLTSKESLEKVVSLLRDIGDGLDDSTNPDEKIHTIIESYSDITSIRYRNKFVRKKGSDGTVRLKKDSKWSNVRKNVRSDDKPQHVADAVQFLMSLKKFTSVQSEYGKKGEEKLLDEKGLRIIKKISEEIDLIAKNFEVNHGLANSKLELTIEEEDMEVREDKDEYEKIQNNPGLGQSILNSASLVFSFMNNLNKYTTS